MKANKVSMSLKDRLADKVRKYYKTGYRSDEGASLFKEAIEAAEYASERGLSKINWPKEPFIKSLGRDGSVTVDDLPDLYLEVKSRLEKEELKVDIIWAEYTDYGTGSYGENEYFSGLQLVISWQD